MINFSESGKIIRETSASAILVVPIIGKEAELDADWQCEELRSLAEAAEIKVLGIMTQNLDSVNAASYIGSGKLEELAQLCSDMEASLVVFNEELTGMQIRNIEDACKIKVIDRTMLILDIFAARASSAEGRLQVEMAQLRYRLPRLVGFGRSLSRLGGGIGTRGPGEKKLETDRRHIKARIGEIRRELREIDKGRGTRRSRREASELPVAALVGYTNSGKSSLMNRFLSEGEMEGKKVFEKDMLFATLDTAQRLVSAGANRNFILIDTVGFVNRLPHTLIEAFKGTLEELRYADLLINVVDCAGPHMDSHIKATKRVIAELGAGDKPVITAYNKCDLRSGSCFNSGSVDSLFVSAKTGEGMNLLAEKIASVLFSDLKAVELLVPYNRGDITSYVCEKSKPSSIAYSDKGTEIVTELNLSDRNRLREYIVGWQ